MGVLSVVGIGVVAAALALVLRQYRPEYAMLVSIAAGIFILYRVIVDVAPVMERVRSITALAALPMGYTEILFRALGMCFITQIACDACKDAGEGAIAAKVELAGKIAVLVVSLPLFEQVLSIVQTLIQ